MEASTEGREQKELENEGNYSLVTIGGKNELLFDEIFALLIQKECELVCLRSELEMQKSTGCKKPGAGQATSNDEGHAIQNLGFGDFDNESHDSNNTFSKITSLFKKNSVPNTTNEIQEAEDQSIQESQLIEIYQALKKILKETQTKIETQINEEKEGLMKQKEELNTKELQLQMERSELEKLRCQLEDEKNKLGNDKRKIELELRNLLADESEWDTNEGENSENSQEQDYTRCSERSHSEGRMHSKQMPIDKKESEIILEEKTDNESLETDKEKEDISSYTENYEKFTGMDENDLPSQKLDGELQQLAEAKADEIILVQEEKLSELEQFMESWKKTVENERLLMNYRMEHREMVGHQIRESCQMAVENISKEWIEIKEAYKKIQMHQCKLHEIENNIATAKMVLEQKEILHKEDLTKIENGKRTAEAEWKHITLEKEKIKTERASMEKDKEKLKEMIKCIEMQRKELENRREIFKEEIRVGEEIQKKVDEKRTSGIIEEQRNLEKKREMLMIEHHDLYKARQICDAHRAILEWERMCIAREKDEVQDEWIQLEKEKMALGIIKATNDEKMMMLETAWKKIKEKEYEMDIQFNELEEERKCISDERISLQSERIHLDELKTTVLTRVSEINTEISQVEQQKKELLSMTSVIDRKKSELEEEREALKLEKRECMKISERTGESDTSWQDYRLKHCEMVKNIKNRILSLVEEVSCMEERSLDGATQNVYNNKLHHQNFDLTKKSEQGIHAAKLDEDHDTQRIKHLVKAVKSMEKDMCKMKSKIKRRHQLKKQVITLKQQVKRMRGQLSNLQENLKEKSEINFNAIDLMNKFMHPYQESLIARIDNGKCDECGAITSIKNIMKTRAGKMAGDWKSTSFLQTNYCHQCFNVIENQNTNHRKGNNDCWRGEMIHGNKSTNNLNNGHLKVDDEKLFEETPYSNTNSWMKTTDKKRAKGWVGPRPDELTPVSVPAQRRELETT
ncbi:golgin subfamily A member 6-like protein 22 isoform X2 [Ischnura elegans]|uniref:golgin subfamily A member 6-like protein 22 isoform X2 n=2 Tax=Ischnura elegans TaxID=197161 RepID=UPI001ED89525|nr:golgin subfamily A member 6-like protein 22 isoform X2 [Ischnura elegans]